MAGLVATPNDQCVDLRVERVKRRLSLAAAADQIGISLWTLSRAERGTGTPSLRHAIAIAKFYGFKVEDFPIPEEATAA